MKTIPFYSHPIRENGEMVGGKLLTEHNAGVERISQAQFYERLQFPGLSIPILKQFLSGVVAYHDLLKYLTYFQAYLRGKEVESVLKNHAAGGALIYAVHHEEDQLFPFQHYLGYFLIRGHHRDLWTPHDSVSDPLVDQTKEEEKRKVLAKQILDLQANQAIISTETGIHIPEAEQLVLGQRLYNKARRFSSRKRGIMPGASAYFLTNYLFSLLIEADKLDASRNEYYELEPLPVDAVHKRLPTPEPTHHLNQLRHQTRMEVRAKLKDPDILTTHVFTLTAPTGIGKTLTALDFALGLRAKLAEERGGRRPLIITALPFINIIEQTLAEYHKYLDQEQYRIVGHYQFADVLGDREPNYTEEDGTATKEYARKLMELHTWQADVVVTSFVQLFHTLISGRNKQLKKFHHLAGAILIMDEVQTIPLDLSAFLGGMLYYLTEYLDTRIIMMTATQPKLLAYTDKFLLTKRGDSIVNAHRPLLANPAQLFTQFERTKLIPLLEEPIRDSQAFLPLFLRCWKPRQACLIVLNTVQRSIEVYQKLCQDFSAKEANVKLYYLSTNVLPWDRRAQIENIKQALQAHREGQGAPLPILVTTQVVEAGVDLDFDCGFRDIGPIDAIVQVAGRLNRENSITRRFSPLYVFQFAGAGDRPADAELVYGKSTLDRAVQTLIRHQEVLEPDYFHLVDSYFSTLENQVDQQQGYERMKKIDRLAYSDEEYGMNNFRYISERKIATVLIELESVREAKEEFEKLHNTVFATKDEFYQEKFATERKYKAIFQQHLLNVPEKYVEDLPQYEYGPYRVVNASAVDRWYRYSRTEEPHLNYGFQREAATSVISML